MKTGKIQVSALIAAGMLAVIVIAVLASFVSAQLGEQSFPELNFTDSVLTDAELDAAEAEFSSHGLLPGHPLYFLKTVREKASLLVELEKEKKAKLHLKIARKRLAEARALADRNMTRQAKESITRFEDEVRLSAEGNLSNASATESREMLGKSSIVLGLLLDRLPEEARPAVERALNSSIKAKVRIEIREETKIRGGGRDGDEKSELIMQKRVEDEQKKAVRIRKELSERREKAEEAIEDAEESLAEFRAELAAKENITSANASAEIEKLLSLAEEKIVNARAALGNSKFGEAYGQANAAEQLVKNAGRRLEKRLEQKRGKDKEKDEEDEETEIETEAEKKIRIKGAVNKTAETDIKIREKVKIGSGNKSGKRVVEERRENKGVKEEVKEIKKVEDIGGSAVPLPSLP